MRERLPRYTIITGSGVMIVGITVTVILVVRRSHCSANPYTDNSACLSYNASIHWAYALIVLGAALFVAAALSATNRVKYGTRKVGGKRRAIVPSDDLGD